MRRVVGVTGAMGGGKSSFARLLADACRERSGCAEIVDADRIARWLVEDAPEAPMVRRELAARFGAEILRADGALDRSVLAARAFKDDAAAADLNAILHPRVLVATEKAIAGEGVFILDVPLLFESGMERICDTTVAVTAPRELRRKRASRFADAEERERRQWPEEQKAAAADFVVVNDATLVELAVHARALAEKLLP